MKFLTYNEFSPIREEELKIFGKLKQKEIFLLDSYGDLVIQNDKPVSVGMNEAKSIVLPCGQMVEDTIPYSDLCGFLDVFGLDDYLSKITTSEGHQLRILTLSIEDNYSGCAWVYNNDKYIAMYAIRSSLENYLLKRKGIARTFLSYLESYANERDLTILVPWPLDPMPHLLRKEGYQELNTNEDTKERQFLAPLTSTSNYFMKKSLKEREKSVDFLARSSIMKMDSKEARKLLFS